MYEYTAWGDASTRDPLGVVDGDTLNVGVDLGFDIAHNITLRLYGVNAPELSNPDGSGQAAKQFVIDWFTKYCPSGSFIVQTVKDNRDKYGRYLADVFSDQTQSHWLNEDLVTSKHAVVYYPGNIKPDPSVPDPRAQ